MGIHSGHRERKRAQFRVHGAEPFADHELLELLLFYAIPRQDTNPMAHALMERFGSLDRVLKAPLEELEQVPGMGPSAAVLIKLIPQLNRRAKLSAAQGTILDTCERLGAFFVTQLTGWTEEVMYQVCLDAKGKLLSCRKVCQGDIASVGLNLRRIVENALRDNAVLVALAHNHPSGLALPSHEDKIATIQIRDALGTVGIQLADHIIVADDDFVSLRQEGLL